MSETQSSTPEMMDEWWAPDVVFQGECRPRRILARGNGHVLFSDGSRKVKEVTEQQFDNWVKKFGCTRDPYRRHSPGGH